MNSGTLERRQSVQTEMMVIAALIQHWYGQGKLLAEPDLTAQEGQDETLVQYDPHPLCLPHPY